MSYDLFKNRRTIRHYRDKPVGEGVLRKILEAGRWAPSAHNVQPWRFIVIDGRAEKVSLAEAMAARWDDDLRKNGVDTRERQKLTSESITFFSEAPVIILACLSMKGMMEYSDESRNTCEYLMGVQSVSLAVENMLLAAHLEGLGAAWYCAPLFCQDTVRHILSIPEDVDPQALLTFGYPSETPKPPLRRALEEITYYNRWGRHL